jgi:hypothetical protein
MLFSEDSWKSALALTCNLREIKITGKLHNLAHCTGNWMHAVKTTAICLDTKLPAATSCILFTMNSILSQRINVQKHYL